MFVCVHPGRSLAAAKGLGGTPAFILNSIMTDKPAAAIVEETLGKEAADPAIVRLDDGDPQTVEEWVNSRLATVGRVGEFDFGCIIRGPDGEVVAAPDRSNEVCIRECNRDGNVSGVWVPEDEVPDWIDVEDDLPVGGS